MSEYIKDSAANIVAKVKQELMTLRQDLSKEKSSKLHEILKSLTIVENSVIPASYLSKNLRKSMKKEMRKDDAKNENVSWRRIHKEAQRLVDSGDAKSIPEGVTKAISDNPRLYKSYKKEQNKAVGKSLTKRQAILGSD